jgi:hypothetical protein
MHWRGSNTGGYATVEGMTRQHRHRFVAALDNITNPVKILNKIDNVWIEDVMSPAAAQALFDVKFSRLWPDLCTTEALDVHNKVYDVTPLEEQQDLWKWKYLLDIDGIGLSNRFYSMMKSKSLVFKCAMFREWYNEWLWPWVHYVPLGLNGSDWIETVRFFAHEEIGHFLGERMANESHIWSNGVLRKEDMEVWVFRLLLEYVFLILSLIIDMLELSMMIVRLSDFMFNWK